MYTSESFPSVRRKLKQMQTLRHARACVCHAFAYSVSLLRKPIEWNIMKRNTETYAD